MNFRDPGKSPGGLGGTFALALDEDESFLGLARRQEVKDFAVGDDVRIYFFHIFYVFRRKTLNRDRQEGGRQSTDGGQFSCQVEAAPHVPPDPTVPTDERSGSCRIIFEARDAFCSEGTRGENKPEGNLLAQRRMNE